MPRAGPGSPPTIGDRGRAALSGGDLLAAAIARPVRRRHPTWWQRREKPARSPLVGACCFAGVLTGLILPAPLAREVNLIGLTKIELNPQQLTERAHTVVRNWATWARQPMKRLDTRDLDCT
jgi:hypothetical protein